MITALSWIPRGASRQRPVRYELSEEEYSRVKDLAREEAILEAETDLPEHEATGETFQDGENDDGSAPAEIEVDNEDEDTTELPAELRMDDYDEDDIEDDEDNMDNYAMLEQGNIAFALDADEDEEEEDNEVRATDSVLVVALTEDDHSHLEIQLLAEDGSMFVHHDISLPEFPLCLAWMDCPPFRVGDGQDTIGSYIAVGTFDPAIEIWNLDVLDPLEPSAVLGGIAKAGRTSKKTGKSREPIYLAGSHTEAVMGLSWNKNFRQALASGSADKTAKIWDVTTQLCSHTFTHHTDKVQSVQWHPSEGWLLATGSFDRSVTLLDCRTGAVTTKYSVSADIEALVWDPFCSYHLYSSTETGEISCFDIRYAQSAAFTFQGHSTTVSSLSFSGRVPGMLASSSIDKTVKVWDVAAAHAAAATSSGVAAYATAAPQEVAYKSMHVGRLFALNFLQDDPFVLACGGDKGMVAVWESDENETVANHFGARAKIAQEARVLDDAAKAVAAAAAQEPDPQLVFAPVAPVVEDDSWIDAPSVNKSKSKEDKDKKKKGKKGKK